MANKTNKPIDNGSNLIVGLVTTHIPLKEIFKEISEKRLIKKIYAFNNSLKCIWGIKNPKIALTSINPHSGEGGLIGNEEKRLISPVLKKLKSENWSTKMRPLMWIRVIHFPFYMCNCFPSTQYSR